METQGHVFFDSSLSDITSGIARYLDELNEDSETSLLQLANEIQSAEDESERQQLYFTLAENASLLQNAPPQKFESSYNQLLYVLMSAPEFAKLMPVVLANLAGDMPKSSAAQMNVLAVLSNLYNILPVNSELRFDVFDRIIDFSCSTGTIAPLIPQLRQLGQLLKFWHIDEARAADLCNKVYSILQPCYPRDAYAILHDVVRHFNNADLAAELVETALKSTFVFDLDFVLEIKSVQDLESSRPDLLNLLRITASGDVAAFQKTEQAQDAVIADKVRVMALVSLASKNTILPYDQISASTGVPADGVELLIVRAIKSGLVGGKMHQNTKEFQVQSVTPVGEFGIEQWKVIDESLSAWKNSLLKTLDSIKNVQNSPSRVRELYESRKISAS